MTKKTRSRSVDLRTLRIFLRANLRYKRCFFGAMATWLGGLMLQKLVLPLIAARALNELVALVSAHEAITWQPFTPYIAWFAVVAVVAQVLIDFGLVLLSKLETYARPDLQLRVFDMLMQQSLRFHANNFSGALVNQTNKFTGAYVALTDNFILSILQLLVNVLLAIVIIAFYAPIIALAMLVWALFFAWLNVHLTKRRMHFSRRAAEADSVLTAHLADSVSNVSAVKSFGREAHEMNLHSDRTYDRTNKKYAAWIRSIKNDAAYGVLMSVLQLLALSLSIFAIMRGAIEIGTLLLIQVYVTQIIGQLWGLSNLSRSVEQNLADAAEMTELLEESILVTDPAQPEALRLQRGAISLKHVIFAHDGENEALFQDFSLDIPAGQKIGLVGHSGSGKTTLTKLLLRFADVDEGAITIDGQDIRSVAQSELRNRIAYVPQEPLLFHRSIRENIAYGKLEATDEQIAAAARQARADEFIAKLPHGYDTLVGERGVKLSGGQRQRIAIARAILKDAPILLLDEATSALDSESEKLIQEALGKLMQKRTVIVIAHRLSTIQKMDKIVVLHDGAIVEQGSHTELLAQKGTYAKLWKHQSGGFLEE